MNRRAATVLNGNHEHLRQTLPINSRVSPFGSSGDLRNTPFAFGHGIRPQELQRGKIDGLGADTVSGDNYNLLGNKLRKTAGYV